MKLDKGIEDLTVESEVAMRTGRRNLYNALQLGIEALKRIQQNRHYALPQTLSLLPGETEE